jgi:hypothetical protein
MFSPKTPSVLYRDRERGDVPGELNSACEIQRAPCRRGQLDDRQPAKCAVAGLVLVRESGTRCVYARFRFTCAAPESARSLPFAPADGWSAAALEPGQRLEELLEPEHQPEVPDVRWGANAASLKPAGARSLRDARVVLHRALYSKVNKARSIAKFICERRVKWRMTSTSVASTPPSTPLRCAAPKSAAGSARGRRASAENARATRPASRAS